MLVIKKLHEKSIHQELQTYLEKHLFLPLFFFSPYTLNTWLTHHGKELCFAEFEKEKILFVYKKELDEIRFLFDYPSNRMKEAVMEHFTPTYIGVNEASRPPKEKAFYVEGEDVFLPLKEIALLESSDVRRKYKKCVNTHPHLKYVPYTPALSKNIENFINEWSTTRTEVQNKHAKIENDFRFLELYQNNENVLGGVVMDETKVIAITFSVPALDDNWIGPINKILRGYTQLGVFTFVERAKMLYEKGIEGLYIGAINNEFKKQFLNNAKINPVYACELYKDSRKTFPEGYVWKVFN